MNPNLYCAQCGVPMLDLNDTRLCAMCLSLQQHPDEFSKRKDIFGIPMTDLKLLEENQRILQIVSKLKEMPGKSIGVLVDSGPQYQGKADRYLEKIKSLLPTVILEYKGPSPFPLTDLLKFRYSP